MILVSGVLTFDSQLVGDVQNILPEFKAEHQVEVLLRINANRSDQLPSGFDSLIDMIEVVVSQGLLEQIDTKQLDELSSIHELVGQFSFELVKFNPAPLNLQSLNNLFIITAEEVAALNEEAESDW